MHPFTEIRGPLACLLIAVGVVVSGLLPPGFAEEILPVEEPAKDTTFIHSHSALRKSMPLVRWRKSGFLNHIYKFDEEPLGERVPVILVPGRAEEFQRSSWWKKFRKMSRKTEGFEEHYKLYAYIYDSKEELDAQTDDFVREMKAYFGDFLRDDRQVILVSYSLGGMITRKAMLEDEDIDELVHTMFAVAVPFHGSPLFDPEWFTQYIRPPNHSPVRRWWDKTVYRLYLFGKDNLKKGLSWNNFDGSKPMYDGELQGHMLVSEIDPYRPHPRTDVIKRKIIIYASYLENEYTNPVDGDWDFLGLTWYVPKAVVGSILPAYTSVHSVFTYMNRQVANLPTYSPEHPMGREEHLYRYNDGVFPISSMLYLPPRDTPYHEDFDELVQFIDVQKARIFLNIDHMHIGEYALRRSQIRATDILHPDEGTRSPNEWLIHDLMMLSQEFPEPAPSSGE